PALDAVLQRAPASEVHLALEPLPEPLRQRDRPAVLGIDQADDARPPERFESVGERGAGGFVRVAFSPEGARQGPADFLTRPTLRVVEADAPREGAGGALLHRPDAVTAQDPVPRHRGHAPPGVLARE